jgi:hypothetical protein
LQAVKVDAAQLFPDVRHALDREAAQFDLLARSDVEHAVTKAARKVGNRAQLGTG